VEGSCEHGIEPSGSMKWWGIPEGLQDHNRKIKSRRQRTDIGKYSFVNRTIINWSRLPADLLASFPSKLKTFRKRVKKVVTNK
jgi:hypothetical protein